MELLAKIKCKKSYNLTNLEGNNYLSINNNFKMELFLNKNLYINKFKNFSFYYELYWTKIKFPIIIS